MAEKRKMPPVPASISDPALRGYLEELSRRIDAVVALGVLANADAESLRQALAGITS
jgi:hypothetical protein